MKRCIIIPVAFALGICGFTLFFGDRESITELILSKPLGIIVLIATYKLYNRANKKNNTTISNNI